MGFLRKLAIAAAVALGLAGAAQAQGLPNPAFGPNTTFGGTKAITPSLPAAAPLATSDNIVMFQGGLPVLATAGQFAALFGVTLPDIDLKFAQNAAGGQCASLAACVTATNGGGFVQWSDGHYSAYATNTLPISDLGIQVEPAGTNLAVSPRDWTNAAWTKTNLTAAATATGIDNTVNSATTLTATSANGTSCQSVTAGPGTFGEFTFSVFVKRITGSGEVDIAMDPPPGYAYSGRVWNPINYGWSSNLSSGWNRFSLTYDGVTNPVICVRVVTNGDVVAVDFGQLEAQVWATSPMLSSRTATNALLTNAASTILNSGTATMIVSANGFAAGNFRHQPTPNVSTMGGATALGYLWQYAAAFSFFNDGSGGEGNGATPYTLCGALSNVGANQSMAQPSVFGWGWSASGWVQNCDGGNGSYGVGSVPSSQSWYVGGLNNGPSGFIQELKIYSNRLSAAFMTEATNFSNPAIVTDVFPPSGQWSNYSQATPFTATVGGVLPIFSGGSTQNVFGFESGPYQYGATGQIQAGQNGNMLRFNMYANNCGPDDDCQLGNYGGSERVELDGSTGAGGNAQVATATDIWTSYAVCLEPGAPLTSNWFFNGQVHQTVNPAGGGSPPFFFNTKIGEYGEFAGVTDGNQGYTTFYEYKRPRGIWEQIVMQLNFDPTGVVGKYNVWLNGTQVVAYSGVTGQVPVSGTQNYYWKFGVYRGSAPEYEAVRYANETFSTSSLMSKVATPDPIPTGYGNTCNLPSLPPAGCSNSLDFSQSCNSQYGGLF